MAEMDSQNSTPRGFRVTALADVPIGAVVISSSGTIAARFDDDRGVVLGDDRPFPWDRLQEPVAVLWLPSDGVPAAT